MASTLDLSQSILKAVEARLNQVMTAKMAGLAAHLAIEFNMPPEKVQKAINDFCDPNSLPKLKEKVKKGEVTIVLNYTPKWHALFGDTISIKDELHRLNGEETGAKRLAAYGPKLDFGPGWKIQDKKRLDEVEKMLKDKEIKYRKVERDDYKKELMQNAGNADDSDNESDNE